MNIPNNKKNKKSSDNYIFRGKSNKFIANKKRILIEAIIMLVVGSNLLVFLYTLPGDFIVDQFLQETWLNFSQAILQLVDSFSKIGGALVVLLLITLGLVLVFGALARFVKLFFTIKITKRRSSSRK